MANITIVALSSVSGVPLFVRHRGPSKPPSYNVVGSLNGVFMFGESQGTRLIEARSPLMAISWKTYHDSVRLILLHGRDEGATTNKFSPAASSSHGGLTDQRLLDLVFNSLVLLLSLETLTTNANTERLKKDLKVCYPLVDMLLGRTQGGSNTTMAGPLFSHLVLCADSVLPPDNYNLQSEVSKWSESQCSSSYGCLLSGSGRVLAATRTYWSLSSTELVLLPLLLLAAPAPNTARDVPIYLPHKSPKMPFRLLGVKLTGQVWCLSVCGSAPSLASVLKSSAVFWGPYYAGLETLAATQPYNMTAAVRQSLDKAVIGLLLVNNATKRCLSCVHLGPSSKAASHTAEKITVEARTSLNTDNRSNYGTETRSRKSVASKSSKSQSPPRSQTNTLKSSSGKTATIHTYQTVELNISPVQSRRALSPHNSRTSSAGGVQQRTLSPSSRANKTTTPSPNTKNQQSLSRALSPTSSNRSSRALSPTAKTSRALSPTASNRSSRTLSLTGSRATRATSPLGRAPSNVMSPGFKIAALASVYRSLIGQLLHPPEVPINDTSSQAEHVLSEAYVWCGTCRVYVLQQGSIHLLVLLPAGLPHTLARSVSLKTLSLFLKGKVPRL